MFKSKLLKGILLGAIVYTYAGQFDRFKYRVLLTDNEKVVEIEQKFCYNPKSENGWCPYERVIVERRRALFGYKYQIVCPLRDQLKEQLDLGTDNK